MASKKSKTQHSNSPRNTQDIWRKAVKLKPT